MVVTRFAPSPNGPLHLGHAYSALMAHDLAHQAGGRFLLRIEDIDGPRSRPELAEEFRADLAWLGLKWEEVPAQSARLDAYAKAADKLRSMGLLYRCHCSRAQIAANARRRGPDGPIYPGTCKIRNVEPKNTQVAWRLDTDRAQSIAGDLEWHDQKAGVQTATPQTFGDVVLLRKALPASYHLAATLDDAVDGVTLVTRGMDLFHSSHIHRLLQALLKLPVPQWHHHALLLDRQGEKLAKRRGSPALADLRNSGEDGYVVAQALRARNFPAGISLSSV